MRKVQVSLKNLTHYCQVHQFTLLCSFLSNTCLRKTNSTYAVKGLVCTKRDMRKISLLLFYMTHPGNHSPVQSAVFSMCMGVGRGLGPPEFWDFQQKKLVS